MANCPKGSFEYQGSCVPLVCDCAHTAYEQGHSCYDQCANGGGGGGGDDHSWYLQEIASKPDVFDTGISEGQWIAWRPYWDDSSKSFRTENVDSAGNPISGTGFGKPVDCPPGTTKFWINQCLPLDDWRMAGGAGGGGGTSAGSTKAQPPPPVPDLSLLPYGPSDLRNSLADMFNYRAGIFGTKDPHLSGATSRAPTDQDIAGFFLPEGGVWWGGSKDLTNALAPFGKVFTTNAASANTSTKPAVKATAPGTQQCDNGKHWDPVKNMCVSDVSTDPVGSPVLGFGASSEFGGVLAKALSQNQYKFA